VKGQFFPSPSEKRQLNRKPNSFDPDESEAFFNIQLILFPKVIYKFFFRNKKTEPPFDR